MWVMMWSAQNTTLQLLNIIYRLKFHLISNIKEFTCYL